MEKELILDKIKSASKNGKIPCRKALELAAEADISPKDLGNLLDEIGVKVGTCQLGCFP